MADEIISFLPRGDRLILVDSTAGGGGHLALLAEHAGPQGHVYAFDRDARAHQEDAALGVAQKYPNTVSLFQQPFSHITQALLTQGISHVDGIICDLGVSSHQLDNASRGFSFQNDGPIDMRMDPQRGLSAYEWLENTREKDIADILFNYGGERKSRAIASYIKKAWPIENSTLALSRLVLSALRQKKWQKIHPATRTFQAIRMAVNEELDELKALLQQGPELLSIGGVIVFLSFHSGEDRLIKHTFKELALSKKFALLTKKPLVAREEELAHNPRARSAKLRALRRIA
jgi:16S rRNA (cytosine1402-N4)-methyltransferase